MHVKRGNYIISSYYIFHQNKIRLEWIWETSLEKMDTNDLQPFSVLFLLYLNVPAAPPLFVPIYFIPSCYFSCQTVCVKLFPYVRCVSKACNPWHLYLQLLPICSCLSIYFYVCLWVSVWEMYIECHLNCGSLKLCKLNICTYSGVDLNSDHFIMPPPCFFCSLNWSQRTSNNIQRKRRAA